MLQLGRRRLLEILIRLCPLRLFEVWRGLLKLAVAVLADVITLAVAVIEQVAKLHRAPLGNYHLRYVAKGLLFNL